MTGGSYVDPKLLLLREQFDRTFAEATRAEQPEQQDFLAIRIAGDPYALRLSEIQSLQVVRKLVAAPSLLPELLGIAGFRGVLTPIYDLGQLLGYQAEPSPKWLVVAQNQAPVGFAFATFDAQLRVTSDRVSAPELGNAAAVSGAVTNGRSALPLLHLPAIARGLAQRIKTFASSQER
jgi:chemotaxis signal transduction protein